MTLSTLYLTAEGWIGIADHPPRLAWEVAVGDRDELARLRDEMGDHGYVPGWTIDMAPGAKQALGRRFGAAVRAELRS